MIEQSLDEEGKRNICLNPQISSILYYYLKQIPYYNPYLSFKQVIVIVTGKYY